MQKHDWGRTYDRIQSFAYIIIGVIGIIISIASWVGWDILSLSATEPHDKILHFINIILGVVSFLLLSIGLERRTWLEKVYQKSQDIDAQLTKVQDQMERLVQVSSRSIGTRYLHNAKEVYDTVARLFPQAQQHVRVVNTVVSGPKTPVELIHSIAETLKLRKNIGNPIRYDVVIALDPSNISSDFVQSMQDRAKIFKDNGVFDCYSAYILESKIHNFFDVLIIDNTHLGIGITRHERALDLSGAILFENQPEVSSQLAIWFDRVIIPHSVPFEEWSKKPRLKPSPRRPS